VDEYAGLFQFLNLPDVALETALGTLNFPDTDADFVNFGVFLPAMLPLWSTEDPSYVGYWKHWFSPRHLTIIQTYIEENLLAREIACDFDQLARVAAQTVLRGPNKNARIDRFSSDIGLESLFLLGPLNNEGSISPEVRDLAARTGIGDPELQQINQIARTTDKQEGLLALAAFAQDPPLACFADSQGYPGDFPRDGMTLTPQSVRDVCTFEAGEQLRQQIAALPFAPPWFTTSDQSPVFGGLLQQGDHAGAWMSLNSSGWVVADAKTALRRLANQTREPGLDLLADAWSAQPHEEQGTY